MEISMGNKNNQSIFYVVYARIYRREVFPLILKAKTSWEFCLFVEIAYSGY